MFMKDLKWRWAALSRYWLIIMMLIAENGEINLTWVSWLGRLVPYSLTWISWYILNRMQTGRFFCFLGPGCVWGGGFIPTPPPPLPLVALKPLTIWPPILHTLTHTSFTTSRHNLIDTITPFVVIMTPYCSSYQQIQISWNLILSRLFI